jgi:scyllo-inositol 2-dehydrogenase (NAD+)
VSTRLDVGLVGCGRIGAFTRAELRARLGPGWLPVSHADAVAAIPELRLAACCDVDLAAAQSAAQRYGAPLALSDAEEMFRRARVDIACVATRSDVRPAIVRQAVEAGVRAVHCEKPLATSVGAAAAMCRALEQRGVAFSYGALRNYMPVYARARDRVRAGEIGELRSITVKFGRTSLLWDHPHSVALLFLFAGAREVESVQAALAIEGPQAPGRIDCDPVVLSATVSFAGGVTGRIVAEGGRDVVLEGSRGTLSVADNGAAIVSAAGIEKDDSTTSGRLLALRELRDALLQGKATSLQPADALRQQEVLFACVQSHLRGGGRVTLRDVDPELVVTGAVQGKPA